MTLKWSPEANSQGTKRRFDMHKIHFSIEINAPKEKVWDTMLGKDSYPEWSASFMPGSNFVGDWSEGSKMLFLAPEESGAMSGMLSRIQENQPYEHLSIEHMGVVQDGKEDTSSEEARKWSGAIESYTLQQRNGTTEVAVDMDTTEEVEEELSEGWPKALQKLKELAEK
jgi:uncharacterized protein YndB with AHSA1/START domain